MKLTIRFPSCSGPGRGEPAQLGRGRAEGGRHQQVMAGPPVRHAARPHPEPGPALQVGHRTELLGRTAGRRRCAVRSRPRRSGGRAASRKPGMVASVSAAMIELKCPTNSCSNMAAGADCVDVVAERLQQPSCAGHRGAALRVVEVALRARPVEHPDPQPARVGADLLHQRARQRRARSTARPACGLLIASSTAGRVTDGPGDRPVDHAAGPCLAGQRALAYPPAGRLEPNQPALARRDANGAAAVVGVRHRHQARRHRGG